MAKQIIAVLALLFLAHLCKGICDDLQFHYADTVFARFDNQRFWDPDISWENKYATDTEGELIRPLRERFPGSSTIFVATTDAWHLLQAIQYALIRLAIVVLVFPRLPGPRWGYAVGLYGGIWVVQAGGFWLGYYGL
ncbi:hypothetical protein [Lewinella sp. IMCC34191]|uniref:hypothetical protein n=1 Tax=Lewinella sp. IMCC34191 TaxID=2259172 RepID=UPI000E2584BE|nr:hypothetical protein [Lewinella sp. IMCC34191]